MSALRRILALSVSLTLFVTAAQAAQEVRIGILSFRPLEQARQQWQATADHLNAHIPGYRFSAQVMYFPDIEQAMAEDRFDFVLTNPEHYIALRAHYGLSSIATLMPLAEGHPVSQFGGVIFTRADRADIDKLEDLRDKIVSSVQEKSFGAYMMQRWTLYKHGIAIVEIGRMRFTGMPQDNAVYDVLSGEADVGFVRTGLLERMVREGKLKMEQVKIINRQPVDSFPQVLSTELYPEWSFSAMPRVPEHLKKQVAQALFEIAPDDKAARTGNYYGFSPPGNYAPVEAAMTRLRMMPDQTVEFDLRDILHKYLYPLLLSATLVLLLVLWAVAHLVQVNRRLRASFRERERLDEALQQANATLEHKVATRTRELQQSEARFREIMQSSPIAIRIAVDGGHRVAFANPAYETLLGVASGEALDADPQQFYADPADYQELLRRLQSGEQISDRLVELNFARRGTRWALASYMHFDYEGQPAILGWFYDVTPMKQIEQALQQSEARFRQMFEVHSSPMLLIDPESGAIVDANNAAAAFYGYGEARMRQMNISDINTQTREELLHERQQALREERNFFVFPHRLADGSLRTVEVHSSPVEVDGRKLLFSIIHDITERQRLEQQMHELAFYDVLTGLPNRRLLLDRLHKALATCDRTRRHAALMFLDLDHFKTLNDLHGHDIGDRMLFEVAQRLRTCIREEDSVARFGGDEFVVMLEALSNDTQEAVVQAETVAEKIRLALAQPYLLPRDAGDPITHHCSSSIGITIFREQSDGVEQLLKWTDMAMYRAKDAGRNSIRFFDPTMQAAVETRAALESDLHEALAQQQFELFYQVQVDAARRPQGAEALLRWRHPQRGLVSPLEFIPLAEETGLILPIGAWVLDTACAQLKVWRGHAQLGNLALSVNVSARQFRQVDFVEQVQAAVMRHGIAPTALKLELTESLVLEDVNDSIAKMKALHEFGVSFAMDDFGTGYSSLSYLKNLPLDQLKIDQSFVRSIASDNADRVMVMTIVDLGMNFELDVVAEGVETEEQFTLLHRYGCGNFQGYLFGKPLPCATFEGHIIEMVQHGKATGR
ncbi:MAG: EAL domain-containing protein [Gammaproteobacteria bacterium]|nr:EAL domain-containing protein [Sideroxydans sp.]MBU3904280.1 EAL domain-containing protein [Gammaproteobacteria bacterium]MBU4150781.1 EAL domain-containing protein [Gammaproteobacteria bacterium]